MSYIIAWLLAVLALLFTWWFGGIDFMSRIEFIAAVYFMTVALAVHSIVIKAFS